MTVRDHMALDLEARTWSRTRIGVKDQAIHHELGMTPVRHAQLVDALLQRPDAAAEMPVEVARLRRLQVARLAQRRRQAIG